MYKNDPKKMAAKFSGTCPTCKKPICKGETITYWPIGKKAYHYACSESDYVRFLDSARDESTYNSQFGGY